jgi:Tfp pilus assembly protein PilZ
MASYRSEETTDRFEKRKIHRFPVQLPVTLDHQEDLSSICTNLSSEGVSVETARKFQVGERVYVQVTIAPNQSPLKMQGQVVWKKSTNALDRKSKPLFEIGIRFIRPLPNPWKIPGKSEHPEESLGFDREYEEDFPGFIPFTRP